MLHRQDAEQVFVVFLNPVVVLPQFGDLPVGMQHSGMVASAEGVADLRV